MKFAATLLVAAQLATLTLASPLAKAVAEAAPEALAAPSAAPAPAAAPADPLIGTALYLDDEDNDDEEADQLEARAGRKPYVGDVLFAHNKHRANHSAPALKWNKNLAGAAKVLAQRCVFSHDTDINGGGYGQNLAAATNWNKKKVEDAISDGWYSEVKDYANYYGRESPPLNNFGAIGHFTQLVWVDSKQVGCATYNCAKNGGLKDSSGNKLDGLDWYTVCNYSPPGNWLGEFADNVKPSRGLPPI